MATLAHPHHSHPIHGLARGLEPLDMLARRIGDTLGTWYDRWNSRHQLASLDDRMLQDIGLTRADVEHEIDKPFWAA